jgi:alkylhydroperoxidase/carboxymuconolactone decarboxylase family protein YurZ
VTRDELVEAINTSRSQVGWPTAVSALARLEDVLAEQTP